MWNLKTITVPEIVEALGIIKKGTDKHTNTIPDNPSWYEIQKKQHFAELLFSFGEYYQFDKKTLLKRGTKKHRYTEFI